MRRRIAGLLLGAAASLPLATVPTPARAAVPHVVQPGETLWSIAAANNFTTRTVAAFNGLSEDALVVTGQTVEVPTVDEGAAALAAVGITPGAPDASGSEPAAESGSPPIVQSAPGMGHVPSPSGELHLDPAAADSWNTMRQEALEVYGTDLYPGGPLSAYRTYEQQAYLYEQFLAGLGAPANPPSTSAHELGLSVDVAAPEMRSVVDEIGWKYGWGKLHGPGEWWHIDFLGS